VKSENEFQKVQNWIKINKLTLNYKKSNCILFTNNKTKTSNDFFITTNNGVIDETEVVKYLRVMIDRKLTWKNQIQHVANKLCIAKRIRSKLRFHAPLTVLRNVYYSIVYSHLHYGVTSWGNVDAKYL